MAPAALRPPDSLAGMYAEQRARFAAGGMTAAQAAAAAPWSRTVQLAYRGDDRPSQNYSFKVQLTDKMRRWSCNKLSEHFANTFNAKHPALRLDYHHLESDPAGWPLPADGLLEEYLVHPRPGREEDEVGAAEKTAEDPIRLHVVRGRADAAIAAAIAELDAFTGSKASPVPVVQLDSLSPEAFAQYRAGPGLPVVIRGAVSAATDWSLDNLVGIMGESAPLTARFYGAGFVKNPTAWPDVGYCDPSAITAGEFSALVRAGVARRDDIYVNCEISSSGAGQLLLPQFEAFGAACGLSLTRPLGANINMWWGAPGHTEPLHCDLTDGTLWQLRGRKRVVLFPAEVWRDLYPFGVEQRMSWAFSQVRHDSPDLLRFPNLRRALAHKRVVELGEGDVLFIPGCWAHEISGIDGGSDDHIFSCNRFWAGDPRGQSKADFLPRKVAAAARQAQMVD